jgi:cell wall-associated NlpC family hydrolase
VGLIKGYGWLDVETMSIGYAINGMPDVGADQMYNNAVVKGSMSTMPDVPGLAVWHEGHIGVYIGNGEVIEAMGTKYGVVKTQLSERSWTAWLEIPYISYITETEETS